MSVISVTVRWAGFTGAPGTSTMNFVGGAVDPVDATAATDALDDWLTVVATVLPTGSSIVIEPDVQWFDAATGALLGVTSTDPVYGPHAGGGGASGSGASGAVVSWTTAGINRGRVVRGRTYIVPIAAAYYQSDGTLTSSLLTGIGTANIALIGAADATFGIWSRPRAGAGGAIFAVNTGHVPDMAAVLRSRRD